MNQSRNRTNRALLLLVIGMVFAGQGPPGNAAVPPPSETPAKVIVNGRTSTAVDITIVNVGQQLPKTFSAPKVKSIPGYTWYVSQHFALRSEVDEKQSRDYLTMAELAYPHCVWIFGGAPAGSDTTRIALSFSRNLERLKKASDIDVAVLVGVAAAGGSPSTQTRSPTTTPGADFGRTNGAW